jgi:hypothetical protein
MNAAFSAFASHSNGIHDRFQEAIRASQARDEPTVVYHGNELDQLKREGLYRDKSTIMSCSSSCDCMLNRTLPQAGTGILCV